MFYTFYQNNSGGHIYENDSVANYLIIEASSLKQAQSLAKGLQTLIQTFALVAVLVGVLIILIKKMKMFLVHVLVI